MPKYWEERLIAIIWIAVSLFFITPAFDFPERGGAFPVFSFGAIILCCLVMIGNSIFNKNPGMRRKLEANFNYKQLRPVMLTLLLIGHVYFMDILGYFTSAALFLISASLFLGIRRYASLILTCVVLFPAMYAFFVYFLKADLPQGVLL